MGCPQCSLLYTSSTPPSTPRQMTEGVKVRGEGEDEVVMEKLVQLWRKSSNASGNTHLLSVPETCPLCPHQVRRQLACALPSPPGRPGLPAPGVGAPQVPRAPRAGGAADGQGRRLQGLQELRQERRLLRSRRKSTFVSVERTYW